VDNNVQGDIRDKDLVRRVIADYEISEVYHLASQAIVRSCSNDPVNTFDINVMGTVGLLEACRTAGKDSVKSVVVMTSDKAFGNSPAPYTEETPMTPLFVYDASKSCQQHVSSCYAHNFGVPVKTMACANVFGPGDPNMSRVIPANIIRLAKGQPAILNQDAADYIREFIFVDDAISGLITVGRQGNNGELYCCGGTEHIKIKGLLEKMCIMMGRDPEKYIQIAGKPAQFKEIEVQYINASKLRNLGWSPRVSLEEGLKKCIEFYSLKGNL
jgi:nucleoside-diphosphate-sugar epimerase